MENKLILKYLNNELQEGEAGELLEWINESKENKEIFCQVKNIWSSSNVSLRNSKEFNVNNEFIAFRKKNQEEESGIRQKNKDNRKLVRIQLLRVAAVLLFLYSFGATMYYFFVVQGGDEYNQVYTKGGEKTHIVLADGTKVWLNSKTSFKYPTNLNKKKVEVYLDGEAFFDVAKKTNRQFVVNASQININVLGTAFNVKSYSDENTIETTLIRGKISLTHKEQINKSLILEPFQKATYYKKTPKVKTLETQEHFVQKEENVQNNEPLPVAKPRMLLEEVDVESDISWKDGRLIFKSEKFEDLAVKLERWYDVHITILDERLKNIRYTGVFEKESIEQALEALSLSKPFNYKLDQNKIIIYGM